MAGPWEAFANAPLAPSRGFNVDDVGSAVRGDLFNSPDLPITRGWQPGQTFGRSATDNAQPFQNIVAHHTGGPTLESALSVARRGDPFRSGVSYGYHFYIDKDGSIVQGAPLDARTNHVKPSSMAQRTARPDIGNENSVGISFVGTGEPNPAQLASAENLGRSLMGRYGIQPQNVVGHGQIQRDRMGSEGVALVNALQQPQNPMVAGQPPVMAQSDPNVSGLMFGGPQPHRAPARMAVATSPVMSDAPPIAIDRPQPQMTPFVTQRPDSMADAPFVTQRPDSRIDAPIAGGAEATGPWATFASTPGPWNSFAAQKPDIGRGKAFVEGVRSGVTANFGDELAGASAASGLPSWVPEVIPTPAGPIPLKVIMGGGRAIGEYLSGKSGEATQAYETARDQVRTDQKSAQEQYPGTYLTGNAAGAVALPVGPALGGATLPIRMARGAGVGAVYGAASGAGEGENLSDRASKATSGALLGGAIGGVAPPIVEGAIQGVRQAVNPLVTAYRGARDPAGEAARRVQEAVLRDAQVDPAAVRRLSPQEFMQSGGEARLMDVGGETTRSLARSAANTSPEGRHALNAAIDERFNSQSARVTDWLRGTFNYPNAHAQTEALDTVSRTINRSGYARAYRDGDRGLWSPELERLTSSPDVVAAMREAATKGKSIAVRDGYGGFNPGVVVENDLVKFKTGPNGVPTYPNLQFWDYTKRALDNAVGQARRAGRDDEAGVLTGLTRQLRDELDQLVPSYQQTRSTAAAFFRAENALEAGQNFVRAEFAIPQTRAALARMSPQERQLFQDGFVSRYIETLEKTGDRRNILNQVSSNPAARQKIELALGPQRAGELEARLRVEGIMDLARSAVQGNSTTARQLAEIGFAGGAGSLGAYGTYNMDPTQITYAAVAGALLAGKRGIDQRVARHVAELLVSNNPQQVQRGVQLVARNNRFMDSLRTADARIAQIGGQEAPKGALVQIPAARGSEDQQPNVPRVVGQ